MASIRIKKDRELVQIIRMEDEEIQEWLTEESDRLKYLSGVPEGADIFATRNILHLGFRFQLASSSTRSKIQPYISLDKPNDDLGSLATETTERGVLNTTYTEKISCDVPNGVTELNLHLRNKNKFFYDDLISSRKIQLDTVLSRGYDEISWVVLDKDGRYVGTATIIMQMRHADTVDHGPDGSTALLEDSGYARYIGKTGDCFNCTKQ